MNQVTKYEEPEWNPDGYVAKCLATAHEKIQQVMHDIGARNCWSLPAACMIRDQCPLVLECVREGLIRHQFGFKGVTVSKRGRIL